MNINPLLVAAFWKRTERKAPDECWPWKGYIDSDGYGTVGAKFRAAPIRAHRISYALHCGPIPAGFMVCHTCDVRHCVNPAHLYAGTAADNSRDMIARGRFRGGTKPGCFGSQAASAKLTEETVSQIIERFLPYYTNTEIAGRFGVSRTAIAHIRGRKSWPHVWAGL